MEPLTLLLAGAGVWMLAEGLLVTLAPRLMREISAMLLRLPERELATGGAIVAGLGGTILVLLLTFATA